MDTEPALTAEALRALRDIPGLGLVLSQVLGNNQVSIRELSWKDIKPTTMVRLSDEVSIIGADLKNTTIPALIGAEVMKDNATKHSGSEPWTLKYTQPGDEGKSATFILKTSYNTAKVWFPEESKQKKTKRQKVGERDAAAAPGATAQVTVLTLYEAALDANIALVATATDARQTQCDELQKVYKVKQTALEKLTDDVKVIDVLLEAAKKTIQEGSYQQVAPKPGTKGGLDEMDPVLYVETEADYEKAKKNSKGKTTSSRVCCSRNARTCCPCSKLPVHASSPTPVVCTSRCSLTPS
jgi:hypothetical protein